MKPIITYPNLTQVTLFLPKGSYVENEPGLEFCTTSTPKSVNNMKFPEQLLPIVGDLLKFTSDVYSESRKIQDKVANDNRELGMLSIVDGKVKFTPSIYNKALEDLMGVKSGELMDGVEKVIDSINRED